MPVPGHPLPSVTTALQEVGISRYSDSKIPEFVLERAAWRGKLIHKTAAWFLGEDGFSDLETWLAGELELDPIDGLPQVYVDGLQEAARLHSMGRAIAVEQLVESDEVGAHGILDYFGPFRMGFWPKPVLTFVDHKSGEMGGAYPSGERYKVHESIGFQLALYKAIVAWMIRSGRADWLVHRLVDGTASAEKKRPIAHDIIQRAPRIALYLTKRGPRPIEFEDEEGDLQMGLAAVVITRLRWRLQGRICQ